MSMSSSSQAQITEEEVRSSLTEFAASNCCYGSQPISKMLIRDIRMNSSFHVSRNNILDS